MRYMGALLEGIKSLAEILLYGIGHTLMSARRPVYHALPSRRWSIVADVLLLCSAVMVIVKNAR
jgi:hypothetical protein